MSESGGPIGGPIGGPMGGPMGGPIGGPISNLSLRQNEILLLFKDNNKITKRDLVKLLGINISAAQMHIDRLKEKGYITRIGGTRGHWQVLM